MTRAMVAVVEEKGGRRRVRAAGTDSVHLIAPDLLACTRNATTNTGTRNSIG